MIHTHSEHQVSETTSHRITGLVSSDDHVLCGDENGDLALRDLYTLHSLTTLPLQLPIQTLALTENKSHILAPLRSVYLNYYENFQDSSFYIRSNWLFPPT